MSKKMLVAAVVLTVASAFVGAGQDKQPAPKIAASAEPDFTGKVLYLGFKEPARATLLQKVRVQRLGGRTFLVGQWAPRYDADERREESYWYPVEDLVTIIEYKNLAAAQKAFDTARREQQR
jgi:hypothetical protein